MATTDTVGDMTSNGKQQRSAGGSPTKNSKKKKEKGILICPICLENIVEATKTKTPFSVKEALAHGCTESVLVSSEQLYQDRCKSSLCLSTL